MEKDPEQYYFDCHNHLLFHPQAERQQIIEEALQHRVAFLAPNCTCQQDYQPMLQLAQRYPYLNQKYTQQELKAQLLHNNHQLLNFKQLQIIPSFGVHPWYTQREKDNKQWLDTLQKLLTQKQHFGLGQIGLDLRTTILDEHGSKQEQEQFFTKQLQLSFKLNRTVSVHCVRAWGPMLKLLKHYNTLFTTSPPANNMTNSQHQLLQVYQRNPIIMHAYNGSKQTTKALLKLKQLNIYFSLGLRAAHQLATVIPIDRLVLQTDAPSLCNYKLLVDEGIIKDKQEADPQLQKKKETQWQNRSSYIRGLIRPLSNAYQMDRHAFATKVFTNSLRAFRLVA